MDLDVALTTALHRVRCQKPEAQVAAETGIKQNQLRKLRRVGIDARKPTVEQWIRLVRCVYEADPESGRQLAQAGLPAELFVARSVTASGGDLAREVLEAASAAGAVSTAYLAAVSDGRFSAAEIDACEGAYRKMLAEAEQGLAACEKARQAAAGPAPVQASLAFQRRVG